VPLGTGGEVQQQEGEGEEVAWKHGIPAGIRKKDFTQKAQKRRRKDRKEKVVFSASFAPLREKEFDVP
jgi:hypothetical protein